MTFVLYFLKPGKERSDPASHHTICLLPDQRKDLDKICATRIALHLKTNGLLDVRHFRFRKNISNVDALFRVLDYISESKELGELTCLLTSNINNAFKSF